MSDSGDRCVKWLHLSDLHLGAGSAWQWTWQKNLLHDDLKKLHPKAGPWDLVIFTGDLSSRGSREDFEAVDRWLADLWDLLKKLQPGQEPQFLAVPGNHDLLRPAELADLGPDYLEAKQVDLEAIITASSGPATAKDPTSVASLLRGAFTTYQDWWDRAPHRPKIRPGPLPGDFAASLEIRGLRLGMVGMNSAALQLTAGEYADKLQVHPLQFYAACPDEDGPAWASQHDACLLLTHHPPSWLAPKARGLLNGHIADQGRFPLHLFGHTHNVEVAAASKAGLPLKVLWQSSALFSEEEVEGEEAGESAGKCSYGYAACELKYDGHQAWARLWPRVAHRLGGEPTGEGEWQIGPASDRIHFDENEASAWLPVGRSRTTSEEPPSGPTISTDGGDPGWFEVAVGDARHPGLWPWEQRLSAAVRGRKPYFVGGALPANSPAFVGRENLLRDVTEAFACERPPSLTLLGERRMGKSSFLNQVFEALKATPGLVVAKGTAQAWNGTSPALFFSQLHAALARALALPTPNRAPDYDDMRRLLRGQAGRLRFVLLIDEFEELALNAQLTREFYSNLRALGDEPAYHFGYLICSRQSLSDLCEASHDIKASAFWNIFATPQYLGLLAAAEASLLADDLWRCATDRSPPDPAILARTAGTQPAFLQIALNQAWKDAHAGYPLNEVEITRSLRDHFRSLWAHRTPSEKRAIANGAHPTSETRAQIDELQRRGILSDQGEIFSPAFRGFIRESVF